MDYFFEVAVVGLHLQPLTYKAESAIKSGTVVQVPVRNREQLGVVLNVSTAKSTKNTIKSLKILEPSIVLPSKLLELAQWMSSYYLCPIAEVFGVMLPSAIATTDSISQQALKVSDLGLLALKKQASASQAELLNWLNQQNDYINNFSSCRDAGFNSRTITACLDRAWIEPNTGTFKPNPAQLNHEQQAAVAAISEQTKFQVCLLDGVTGSGKTEVYCALIQAVLANKQQALVLVPEIGLTKQTLARFVQRCGSQALVIHSKVSPKLKSARWHMALEGTAQLVIGTRSALFMPLDNLGLIIIDEGHDASFKQQNTCCYSAKHTAIMLAKLHNIPIVLGSATPSLESLHKVNQGSYKYLQLTQRAFAVTKPKITLLDARSTKHEQGMPLALKPAIAATLARSSQVLVFINRRGYAAVLLCHGCGWANKCPSCDTNYILHAEPAELRCHHCNKRTRLPERCPDCGAKSWIKAGFGTQKVTEILSNWQPSAKILRIDRDNHTTSEQFNTSLAQINEFAADIIVGTQMLAKGHDFTNIGLVIILDSDGQLYNPDYKSHERLAQLLVQVAGRTGRRQQPGQILVPTHQPDHPVFTVLEQGYGAWAQQELALRKKHQLEPYIFSIIIHIQAQDPKKLAQIKTEFAQHVHNIETVTVIGPIANMRPKRKGYWRYVVILEAQTRSALHQQAQHIRQQCLIQGWYKLAKWRFDVDPIAVE